MTVQLLTIVGLAVLVVAGLVALRAVINFLVRPDSAGESK